MSWLTGDITIDRTPDIRDYLIHELGVNEVTPETVARWLSRASGFLAKQPDAWITLLYEFLNEHPALLRSPYGRRHQLLQRTSNQVGGRAPCHGRSRR